MTGPDIVPISLPTPFPVGPVNAFLIKGDPVTLVDTGAKMEEGYAQLRRALQQHGLDVKDIRVVLVTHGHLDHMGLLNRIQAESGAESYAHPMAVERLRDFDEANRANHAFHLSIMRETGVPEEEIARFDEQAEALAPFGEPAHIGHALNDGDRVGPFTAYHVPGHSSSDTLFVDHDRRIAFTGDHLLKGIRPNPSLRRPPDGRARPKSLVEYLVSLRRTRALDLDVCYPGHGEPITDHRAVIDSLLKRLDDRSRRILTLMGDRELTPYEVTLALYPRLETKLLILGLSVAVGHLEVLEESGAVAADSSGGILRYKRTA